MCRGAGGLRQRVLRVAAAGSVGRARGGTPGWRRRSRRYTAIRGARAARRGIHGELREGRASGLAASGWRG